MDVNGVLLGVLPSELRSFTQWKRDVGSIPITRSTFISTRKNRVNQWFWFWELINLTTKTYNISIVVHGCQKARVEHQGPASGHVSVDHREDR